jgi:hypothetical protein
MERRKEQRGVPVAYLVIQQVEIVAEKWRYVAMDADTINFVQYNKNDAI